MQRNSCDRKIKDSKSADEDVAGLGQILHIKSECYLELSLTIYYI